MEKASKDVVCMRSPPAQPKETGKLGGRIFLARSDHESRLRTSHGGDAQGKIRSDERTFKIGSFI